ncbi:MAG: ion channel [Myxococcota bacterium]
MTNPAPTRPSDDRVARYSVLLVGLALVLFAVPFLSELPPDWVPLFELIFSALFLAGIWAVSRSPRSLAIGLTLALPAVGLEWFAAEHPQLVLAAFLLQDIFFLYMIVLILRTILRERTVSLETILGGVAVFLLIGISFALLYGHLEYTAPGSFAYAGQGAIPGASRALREGSLVYFSFITLTTLGYGDITPVSSGARALATLEAVVGQLYVAIFVARLVGMYLTASRRSDD